MGFLENLAKAFEPKLATSTPAPLPSVAVSKQIFPDCIKKIGARKIVDGIPNVTERDRLIKQHILNGNVPSFLNKWALISTSATVNGSVKNIVFSVLHDYLMVGHDEDFLYANMSWNNAREIAENLACILPTKKMVNLIYQSAPKKLTPHPLPPTVDMPSTAYMIKQGTLIEDEKHAILLAPGSLAVGHKKDVVISTASAANPNREAIYGWHMSNGKPIQPLSFAHDMNYSDYSHGGRLVSNKALLDGGEVEIMDVLRDPTLCLLLSDEGRFK